MANFCHASVNTFYIFNLNRYNKYSLTLSFVLTVAILLLNFYKRFKTTIAIGITLKFK